ncbi:MAG: dephospho-CoA kinase [Granulosicoccaceae bacterium]
MLKIGLTGGIASGKSTVAKLFESLDVPVIYADKIAREVVKPGSEGLRAIAQQFGDEIIDDSGSLDRRQLREIIFSDQNKKELLESILHPLIRKQSDDLESQARLAGHPYVIFEIPLLLETNRHKDMDRVLVVDVSAETQIARVVARDKSSAEAAKKILAMQSSRADRLAIADDVIENEGEIDRLELAVQSLHKKYLVMSTASTAND